MKVYELLHPNRTVIGRLTRKVEVKDLPGLIEEHSATHYVALRRHQQLILIKRVCLPDRPGWFSQGTTIETIGPHLKVNDHARVTVALVPRTVKK